MSIRKDATEWFNNKYGKSEDKTYSSKFYLPHESWPKKEVWWFVIPLNILEDKEKFINLLCQVAPLENEFHYLKVPVSFFKTNMDKFDIVGESISIYLDANPEYRFCFMLTHHSVSC